MPPSKPLRIWVLQIGENMRFSENPSPMRMGCLVEELAERGHSVLWWGSAFDHFKKEWLYKADTLVALRERVEFFALRGMGYKKNISLSRFLDHRLLSWKFRRLAPSFPAPDVLVASIPPYDLAYEAAVFSSNRSIPYLVDIRDPWPELFVDHCPSLWRGVARFLLGREFRMVRKAIFSASMVLSVTDEMLAWGIRCAGREKTGRDRVLGLGFSPSEKGGGRRDLFAIERNGRFMEGEICCFIFGSYFQIAPQSQSPIRRGQKNGIKKYSLRHCRGRGKDLKIFVVKRSGCRMFP
jgi:hypothetical protein